MREVLRQEKKYLLTYEQFRSLDGKLAKVLHADEHTKEDGYTVRSLYFDSLDDRDFNEKEDGIEVRRKIRLRTYSAEADFAFLEMKQKQGENQLKRSLKVSREDAIALSRGNYECLLHYEENLAKECYAIMQMFCYRPKTVIDYRRKAYVVEENKTRITFDYHIRATEANYNIFDTDLNQNPVFDPYLVVLEVKYNGFLLEYIKELLNACGKSQTSVSKYCLGRGISMHYVF